MIRYALVCEHEHGFEAWFGSSSDYEDQALRGLVECPVCTSTAVRKQIMAPALAGTKRSSDVLPPEAQAKMRTMVMETLGKVRRHVEENFDYVGGRFAREARDIHDGRAEPRGIYGEASSAEVQALARDGVQIAPLPSVPEPKLKTELN